jgi:hypothetical protein
MKKTERNCFVSLFQMNDRFGELYSGQDNYEYAEMQLIATKVIKIPADSELNRTGKPIGECAFIDGVQSDIYNTVHLKIKKMTAGRYVFFYTAKFRRDQLCRKLNVVLHSKEGPEFKRLRAKEFGIPFLNNLERKNFLRSCQGLDYVQPNF